MQIQEYLNQFKLKTETCQWYGKERLVRKCIEISSIVGLTPIAVTLNKYNDSYENCEEIFFEFEDRIVILYHEQDCCESVWIESIVGDINDLVGSTLLMAEESSGEYDDACESGTWTFYKFATIKGYVDVRFIGESNGYYSESVDVVEYYKAP